MPISNISMMTGKSVEYRKAIVDSLYRVLQEQLNVPDGDKFVTITEHDPPNFHYGDGFDIERSDDLLFIAITVFDTRTTPQKQALYRRLVDALGENPGVRPNDVFVNLYEAAKENWSVGMGEMQFRPRG